ncbi:MAG: hypothetical protein Q9227_002746 [Pyrenula ochraceoflavens]
MYLPLILLVLSFACSSILADTDVASPILICDPPNPPNLAPGYKVALPRDSLLVAIDDFCSKNKGKDIRTPYSFTYAAWGKKPWPKNPANEWGQQAIELLVEANIGTPECHGWDGKLDQNACQTAFQTLTDSCDTATTLAKRGGNATYQCANWQIKGSGGADTYRLHLVQRIDDHFSEVEWTLYDSRDKHLGGPDKTNTATGAPYNLSMKVDHPTDRDGTNIHLYYPADSSFSPRYSWSTGWTGKGSSSAKPCKLSFCDSAIFDPNSPHGWKSSNGVPGTHREFDCWFRGWAKEDGHAGDQICHSID